MTNERRSDGPPPQIPLDPPDVSLEEMDHQITGDQPEGDQVAYVRQGEIDDLER